MKTVITAFELMGMPPDTDSQAQNDIIDNSIQERGWIHLHLDEVINHVDTQGEF